MQRESYEKIFLAKVPWLKKGEEWSPYIASRIRKVRAELERVRTEIGDCVEGQKEVLMVVAGFYEDLYRKRKIDSEWMRRFLETITEKVEGGKRVELGKEIKITEMEKCLKTFKGNKSPEKDGLPAEFYTKKRRSGKHLKPGSNANLQEGG